MLGEYGKQVRIVLQTGSKTPRVTSVIEGLESLGQMYVWNNLTPKGVAHVFDLETEKWLGNYRMENGIPKAHKANEELYFKDFYTAG